MKTKIVNKMTVELNAEEISALERTACIIKDLTNEMLKGNFMLEFKNHNDTNCFYDRGDIEEISAFLLALAYDDFSIE